MNSLLSTYGSTTVIAFINGLAQGLLVSAPLTYIASERYLGRRVTIGQAYRAVAGRLLFLGIALVIFYVIFGVLLLSTGVSLFFLIGLGLIGIDIYFGINFYAFLVPVVVLERQGLTRSISRAWSLAQIPLLAVVLAHPGRLHDHWHHLSSIYHHTNPNRGLNHWERIVYNIPRYCGHSDGGYHYLRGSYLAFDLHNECTMTRVIRREGLDIALASVQVEEPRPADVASPPPGPFMAQQDWRSLLLVSVVGLAPWLL